MPGGVHLGVGGRTGCGLPSGMAALGGYRFWGLVWVWLGLVWVRHLVPSPPSAAAVVVLGEAPGVCAGPVRRAGGVPGAVAWLVGAAAAAPWASRASSEGWAVGAAVWAAGVASPAGAGPRAGGSGPPGAARLAA